MKKPILKIGKTVDDPVVVHPTGPKAKRDFGEKRLKGRYVEVFPTADSIALIQMLPRHTPAHNSPTRFTTSPLMIPAEEVKLHGQESFQPDDRFKRASKWRASLKKQEITPGQFVSPEMYMSDEERFYPDHIFSK